MIARIWRGWAAPDNADEYQRIVLGEVIPAIEARRIPGFRSIDLMRRARPEGDVEFTTIMWFDSLEAIVEFMGDDYEVAHVPELARQVLNSWDDRSAHFEVVDRREQTAE